MKLRPHTPWLVFFLLWACQWIVAVATPLFADEAYYLVWSRNLGLGYFDHPPGIAWWIGSGFEWPRLPGLLLLPIAWLFLADTGRTLGIKGAEWAPAMVVATPLGFSASILATPDAPLIFFWCVALWGVARRKVWIVGFAIGACLWSKSLILLAIPGLFWVLGVRAAIQICLIAGVIYLPHIAWSAAHDWLPWSFQATRRMTGFHLAEALGGQALVVTPGVLYLACLGWRRWRDPIPRPLIALSLPVFAVWMVASCFLHIEANWTALAWPATILLVLHGRHRWLVHAFISAGALTVCAAITLVVLANYLPLDVGPPRDGPRLASCLEARGVSRPLAGRYQEMALLQTADAEPGYLPWLGHRSSQFDLQKSRTLACGFAYLGTPEQLGGRCEGRIESSRGCGRAITLCNCRLKKEVARPKTGHAPSEDG